MEAWGLVARMARVTKVSLLQVEVLLACGGDGDLYDRLGYSPYSLAIKSKCERTIALLSHLYDRSRFTICVFCSSLFYPPAFFRCPRCLWWCATLPAPILFATTTRLKSTQRILGRKKSEN